jgi:hypothetical protein
LLRKRRWTTALPALAVLILAVALAGCGAYKAGEPFRESVADQTTPEGAVQKWLHSMEWRINPETDLRDPNMGRDFQAYFEVSSPVLFPPGLMPDDEDWQELEDNWDSQSWEVEFNDLQFTEPEYDGETAVIKIIGGQVRYIGKEMFGTTEYKVDNFQKKNGEITLEKIDDKWRVVKGKVLDENEYWEVQ